MTATCFVTEQQASQHHIHHHSHHLCLCHPPHIDTATLRLSLATQLLCSNSWTHDGANTYWLTHFLWRCWLVNAKAERTQGVFWSVVASGFIACWADSGKEYHKQEQHLYDERITLPNYNWPRWSWNIFLLAGPIISVLHLLPSSKTRITIYDNPRLISLPLWYVLTTPSVSLPSLSLHWTWKMKTWSSIAHLELRSSCHAYHFHSFINGSPIKSRFPSNGHVLAHGWGLGCIDNARWWIAVGHSAQ